MHITIAITVFGSINTDSVWHSGPESDGLAEAIQLLTLRATRPAMASAYPAVPPPSIGAPFIEESSSQSFFVSFACIPFTIVLHSNGCCFFLVL